MVAPAPSCVSASSSKRRRGRALVNRRLRALRLGETMTAADDVRSRLGHVIALLSPTARGSGALDWRDGWLVATLAIHELEAVLSIIRKQLS
jgi:hypothetical protein